MARKSRPEQLVIYDQTVEQGDELMGPQVTIRVVMPCNQDCTFCFVDRTSPSLSDQAIEAAIDEAAEKGLLRQYTAWAVALGESGAWAGAVADASRDDPGLATNLGTDLAFVHLGSSILRASNTATTKPASSDGDFGGGGGFSGSVGGGGGGGGGGSW